MVFLSYTILYVLYWVNLSFIYASYKFIVSQFQTLFLPCLVMLELDSVNISPAASESLSG